MLKTKTFPLACRCKNISKSLPIRLVAVLCIATATVNFSSAEEGNLYIFDGFVNWSDFNKDLDSEFCPIFKEQGKAAQFGVGYSFDGPVGIEASIARTPRLTDRHYWFKEDVAVTDILNAFDVKLKHKFVAIAGVVEPTISGRLKGVVKIGALVTRRDLVALREQPLTHEHDFLRSSTQTTPFASIGLSSKLFSLPDDSSLSVGLIYTKHVGSKLFGDAVSMELRAHFGKRKSKRGQLKNLAKGGKN